MVPVWKPELCIQCGNCAMVCPHATIRARYYDDPWLANAPDGFASAPLAGRGLPEPAVHAAGGGGGLHRVRALRRGVSRAEPRGRGRPRHQHGGEGADPRARTQQPRVLRRRCPTTSPSGLDAALVRGAQYLTPLFEFSGACAGCGETPYLRLLTQLFGDRLLVANATGCSSIYGGNLPTTPWSVNKEGRGPAWANSLFEDNAEFGLGFRLSLDTQREEAERSCSSRSAPQLGLHGSATSSRRRRSRRTTSTRRRDRVAALDAGARSRWTIADRATPADAHRSTSCASSVWIVGGDGWAYDIGYGGLDHVLASGRNVNILVLDTEVYSNTGGQASKSTPRGAVAKFAAGGKPGAKKDLGLMAVAYGNVYVAQIAMGASSQQTMDAFLEAEAHDGPSIIIAYSHCIAHGINMRFGMRQQKLAVECGHWPLYRFRPAAAGRDTAGVRARLAGAVDPAEGVRLQRDPLQDALLHEPGEARRLLGLAQEDVDQRWRVYSEPGRPVAGDQPARPGRAWQSRAGPGRRVRKDATTVKPRRSHHGHDDPLHGPDAQEPARGLGVTAVGEPRHDPPARRQRRRRRRDVLALRRADPSRLGRPGALHVASARDSFGEALSYFPADRGLRRRSAQYLDLIRKATEAVDIPIIASLNGISERGWVTFAKEMEDAGASGIELNVYYIPTETFRSGAQVEQQYSTSCQR